MTSPSPIIDGLKQCSRCYRWLPLSEFYPRRNKPGGCGYQSHCKDCERVRVGTKERSA